MTLLEEDVAEPTQQVPDRHLLLIDLSAVFWPAYHTSADLDAAAPVRKTVGRVHAFVGAYDHIAICIDQPKCWRHDRMAEWVAVAHKDATAEERAKLLYKANRDAKPEDAKAGLRNSIEQLRREGFPIWGVDNMEADDVIASAVRIASANGIKVTVLTNDKDLLSLVRLGVRILSASDNSFYEAPQVKAKFGVEPEALLDWLALVGDSSDNVPGLPGTGPKGATALLTRFGSLKAILDAPRATEAKLLWELRASQGEAEEELGPKPTAPDPPLTPKLKEALTKFADQIQISRELVSMRDDLKIDIGEAFRPRVQTNASDAQSFDESEDDEMNEPMPANDSTPEPKVVEAKPEVPALEIPPPPKSQPKAESMVVEFNDKSTQTAIVRQVEWNQTLEPRTLRDARLVAERLYQSNMFGHLNNADGIFAAMLLARAHGISTMKLLMPGMLNNIRGRIGMSAQLIVGLVLSSGKCQYFDMVESTDKKATYVTKRVKGRREIKLDYTIEQAHRAGLLEPTRNGEPSQYIKRPETMLMRRCETGLARVVYQDVIGGVYSLEEVEEIAAQEVVRP